jgi:hypothetical protein
MGLWLRIALLLPLAALAGCGAGTSAPTAPSLTGNWEIDSPVTPADPYPNIYFSGSLQSINGSVIGTFRDFGPCLPTSTYFVAVAGTVDTSGDLVLTIPLGAPGTVTVTATLGPNLEVPASGTEQVGGGTCFQPNYPPPTPITITQYASATGTYSGTIGSGASATTVTVTLNQTTTPDPASSTFALSGGITTTGACISSGTFGFGFVSGSIVFNESGAVAIDANIDPTASTITGNFTASPCSDDPGWNTIFNGTLTRQ